jgi:hypothetical protein
VLASETPEVILPLTMQPLLTPSSDRSLWLTNPAQWWVNIMARAKPDVNDVTAQAELDTQLSSIVRATMPIRKGEDVPALSYVMAAAGCSSRNKFSPNRYRC